MVTDVINKPNVLVVDDESMVVELLQNILEEHYTVYTATSGIDALEIIKREDIGVLITDQRMPKMTGVELITEAKQIRSHMVSILLTAYTDPKDMIAAINEGHIFRFMTKPWDISDLLLTCKQAMENYHLSIVNEKMVDDLKRRLKALQVFYNISQETSFTQKYDSVIATIMENLDQVIPFDYAAALITLQPELHSSMTIYCPVAVPEENLIDAKTTILSLFNDYQGVLLREEDVIVRLNGAKIKSAGVAITMKDHLHVPLKLGNTIVGVLYLASSKSNCYNDDEKKILDILANQTAETVKNLRKSLSQEYRTYEQFVSEMHDGVIMFDEQGKVLLSNPQAKVMLTPNNEDLNERYIEQTFEFNPTILLEVENWRKQQEINEKIILLTAYPIKLDKQAKSGCILIARDITEEYRLEDKKREFLSVVSHELRTPLSSINAALDLVLDKIAGEITEQQEKYLSMARISCRRINRLIDDLIDIERFTQGKMPLSPHDFSLTDIMRTSAARLQPMADEHGHIIAVNDVSTEFSVYADERRIDQVLSNLISNAIKYSTPKSQINVAIYPTADCPEHVCFTVTSQGNPIPAEEQDRIFQRFIRLKNTQENVDGSGLGLAISKNIIDSHGGDIWLENFTTDSNTFVVVLPKQLKKVEEEANTDWGGFDLAGKVVALNTENHGDGYVIKSWLRACGAIVHFTQTAEQFVELNNKQRFNLLFLESAFSDMPLSEIKRLLAHNPELSNVITIFAKTNTIGDIEPPYKSHTVLEKMHQRLIQNPQTGPHYQILVVDDDDDIRSLSHDLFSKMGFSVLEASNGEQCMHLVKNENVDLVLLDINMPGQDGFTILNTIRSLPEVRHTPVVFCSVRRSIEDKLQSFQMGADDYIVKPFDPLELGARVKAVLTRRERERAVSPTTGLPGGISIANEVTQRIGKQQSFALGYIDLDNLKGFNDYYGYAKADAVIQQTGDILREVLIHQAHENDFVGHIAGDDFVFITNPEQAKELSENIIKTFDRFIPLYYSSEDRQRGYIETTDRFGELRKFPIMSISISVILIPPQCNYTYSQLSELSASVKAQVKAIPHSAYKIIDLEQLLPD